MATSTPDTGSVSGKPPAQSGGRRLHGVALVSVLAALMLTLLLEALDQTIVGTALPKIIAELQGFDRYSWVVTAYLIGSTTMIPIVGKLSDQFGRKWFFVAGVCIFLLGSALSGTAQTMNQLIVFRVIQGLGAGTGIALVYTVVGDIFPPAERARWQGIFGAVYGFSSVVGPTIGGWLTDHGPLVGTFVTDATRWRWVFYVNIPVGIVALVMLLIYLPANISARSTTYRGWAAVRRIDFAGSALASAATICLLLGLTWGGDQTYDWASPQVVGVLVGAVALYAAFFFVERVAVEPILPLDLFKNQVFAADAALSLLTGMVLLSLAIYLPLFLQGVLRESATNSGAVITPLTLSLVVGASLAGIVIGRLQRYQAVTIVGAVLMTIGTILMTCWTPSTSLLTATINMIIAGLGLGMFFPVLTLAVQNALPRTRMGVGTGAVTYLRSLGQTLGVAIVGSVVNNTLATEIPKYLPANAKFLPPAALKALENPQLLITDGAQQQAIRQGIAAQVARLQPGQGYAQAVARITQQTETLIPQVFDAVRHALATAITRGFMVVVVFCVVLLICTFFLKDIPLATSFTEEHAPTPAENAETPEASAPVL